MGSYGKLDYMKVILSTLGTGAASSLICSVTGITQAIPAYVIGTVIGLAYNFASAMNGNNFCEACEGLQEDQLIKVTYMNTDNGVATCYKKYNPIECNLGYKGYNTYLIENPYYNKAGDWIAGEYGHLYRII